MTFPFKPIVGYVVSVAAAVALVLFIVYKADSAESIRSLTYQYNANVIVTVTNQPCPVNEWKDKFPLIAIAERIDGEILKGCYTHDGDSVLIKWEDKYGEKGEVTKFHADKFLGFTKKEDFKGEF